MNQIQNLEARLARVEQEIIHLKGAIAELRARENTDTAIAPEGTLLVQPMDAQRVEPVKPATPPIGQQQVHSPQKAPNDFSWERFVGEQLLSKVGILILIAGVIIGAKIAIDKNLLSDGAKVFGGFLVAGILGFFAWKFFEKYRSLSAVMFAGSMASAYFISYAGFVFYHLYPYWLSFILLLIFTSMTVAGALRYNLVIIAHVGLLGAYILPGIIAVKPAHLSNYLAYMAVINAGILVIALMRNWKSLSYVALSWTFLVMAVWYATTYNDGTDFGIALTYSLVYMIMFHLSTLANVIYERRSFAAADLWLTIPNMILWLILANIALVTVDSSRGSHSLLLGGTSAFYALIALWFRLSRRDEIFPFRTHIVLALAALTLAFMVRINGETLFIVLTAEALLFTYLAFTTGWQSLNVFAFIILLITTATGLGIETFFDHSAHILFTPTFLKVVLGPLLIFGVASFLRKTYGSPVVYLLVIGFIQAFLFPNLRFSHYFNDVAGWQLCTGYSLLLLSSVRFAFKDSDNTLRFILTFGSGVLMIIATTTVAFSTLSAPSVIGHYLTLAGAIFLILWNTDVNIERGYYVFAQLLILWAISFELLFWLNISGSDKGYKLLLSLIWTSYAIFLIYSGIQKRIVGLRVAGMIILGITVLKLFFYDLSRLSGISKTLVMMAIGGLLLLGAYFYQRFMREVAGEERTESEDE